MYCYVALNCPIGMHYQLVLNWYLHQPKSHQLSFNKGTEIPGPIDWTPGIPGFDKKRLYLPQKMHKRCPKPQTIFWPYMNAILLQTNVHMACVCDIQKLVHAIVPLSPL